jgi:hypothetical protein
VYLPNGDVHSFRRSEFKFLRLIRRPLHLERSRASDAC